MRRWAARRKHERERYPTTSGHCRPNRRRTAVSSAGNGFADLFLFYVVTGISLRWIATAASGGPSAIVIWIGAWLCFYLPLALSVLELSSRYPQEGGLYIWTKQAFGGFAWYMSAWTYWTSNLPYFPAVLYFAASNALYMRPRKWTYLALPSATLEPPGPTWLPWPASCLLCSENSTRVGALLMLHYYHSCSPVFCLCSWGRRGPTFEARTMCW
jgi:amino acid transporter